jgi:hypothetical protein
MSKLIKHIASEFKSYSKKVLLVENNDRFLYRKDVIAALSSLGIEVSLGTSIQHRIAYELKDSDELLLLVSQDNTNYLEDIQKNATRIEIKLSDFVSGYHIPTIKDLELNSLDTLFNDQPIISSNRAKTQKRVKEIDSEDTHKVEANFHFDTFKDSLESYLNENSQNWSVIGYLIGEAISKTIGTPEFTQVMDIVDTTNEVFQHELSVNFDQKKNSSAIKKPKIVSKVLNYLSYNYKEDKVALIVIDGMSLWQHHLIKEQITGAIHEHVIYSWIPSITQLSRQAIFRGDNPKTDYRQGPVNEEKLWKKFWKSKGIHEFEIGYQHENIDVENLGSIKKLALVFKELDDKIHASTDYTDLIDLTRNWIDRSNFYSIIEELKNQGFTLFLTSDHGNIQTKGWRGLKGKEKLGTNKSGSRSERHIEYEEDWLSDEFLENNPDIQGNIARSENVLYFTNDFSFSRKESLVSHGGSHLLEVLIPFTMVKNES